MKVYNTFTSLILLAGFVESYLFCYKDEHCSTGYCDVKLLKSEIVCQYGKCGCPKGQYMRYNKCFPKRQHGDACHGFNECSEEDNLNCIQNICKCRHDLYKVENRKCVPKKPVKLGEKCRFNNKVEGLCIVESSYCKYDTCTCIPPLVRDGNICRRRQYKEACSTKEKCPPPFSCINKKCECRQDKKLFKVTKPNGETWNVCSKDAEIIKSTAKGENHSCGTAWAGSMEKKIKIWVISCPDHMTCASCTDADDSVKSVCRKKAT
ncbi:DgyrCDS5502 [Dimorphilus gyrociliatus]|uniref:DgyrCDS5502 n=1 Tax=Dimorphilus gyrociliatus TaxID=2664684 RepID=A0A7I8VPW1_9ANNE|nr:DgyrCDS5502 [Dimorphilus gyrociliatus]